MNENDLFKNESQKEAAKSSRRKSLNESSKLSVLKELLYSKTKKIVERPRRNVPPKVQKVQSDWVVKESADKEFDYNKAVKANIIKQKKQSLLFAKLSKVFIVVSLLFAIGAIVYAGLVFFAETQTVSASKIQIKTIAPSSIASGEIFQMKIDITNNNTQPLNNATLIIKYPEGTKSPSNPKTDMTIQRLQLGSIDTNQTRSGTVRAIFFSKKDSLHKIKIELQHRPKQAKHFSSVVTYHTVRINSDAVETSINLDKEAIQRQKIFAEFVVASKSSVPMYDLALVASYPFGFKPDGYSILPDQDDNVWFVDKLEPGEQKTFKVSGKMPGQHLDEVNFAIKVGFKTDDPEKGIVVVRPVIAEANEIILIKKPFIGMSAQVNNKTLADSDQDFYVINTDNKNIPVKIKWQNNLDTRLENVIFAVSIYGNGVNPFDISPHKGFYDSSKNLIIWNKTTDKTLASVAAKQKGELNFKFSPLPKDELIGKKNPVINLALNAAAQRLSEQGVREALEAVKELQIRLNTDIKLDQKLLYQNNPFVSSGPIPPQVNQQTTYAIQWSLSNTTNDVKDAKVTANLPIYVKWLDLVTPASETITYDKINHSITWHVGDIKANTGYDEELPAKTVTFGIGITPSASHLNKVPDLLLDTKAFGKDEFTQQTITEDFDNLNISDVEGTYSTDPGRVVLPTAEQ